MTFGLFQLSGDSPILAVMKKYFPKIESELLVAMITIAVVAVANAWLMSDSSRLGPVNLFAALAIFVLFALTFLFVTRDEPYRHDTSVRVVLLAIEYLLVLGTFVTSPFEFNAILLVIWSGQLPYFIPYRRTLWLSPLWSAVPWLVFALMWEQTNGLWLTAILFWTFNLFSLMMMESRKQAEVAREQAEQANRELRALQDLMQQASRKDERTRIARDIHDLVGHHLTALSLHLQVASRTVAPEQRPPIDQCLSIARLLLSDVREAVSDMREFGSLDLQQALNELIAPLQDKISVTIDCEGDLSELSLLQATTILRCVQESLTNSIRHGKASELRIEISRKASQLVTEITDNGTAGEFQPGNGLTGIKERVAELNGSTEFNASPRGFHTLLMIPEPG